MTSCTPPMDSNYPVVVNQLPPDQDFDAPFGYEPEGSSCCGESVCDDDGSKQAAYSQWSNNLTSLLNSKGGLKALQKFLKKTNQSHFEMLMFLSACRGVAEAKNPSDKELVLRIIFQKFILTDLFEVDKNKRNAVVNHFEGNKRGEPLCSNIFKDICRDIEDTMEKEMYPNFLAYQAEKLENRNKSSCRGGHDCKKHFFQQRRSTCQTKPTGKTDHFDLDNSKPPEPQEFYKVLMQKLEKVKNEEEDRTKEYRSQPEEIPPLRDVLARVISDKIEDSNYEDILDQHIAKVLPDYENHASGNYDLHKYSDSKKFMLAKNPAMYKETHVIPHPYNGTGPTRRRSKDVYSIDSGFGTGGYYSDDTRKDSECGSSDRFQPRKINETWASRQTLADSGTGMISGDEYAQYNEKMCEKRDKYRTSHINDGNKYRMSHPSETDKYRSYHVSEGEPRYKYNFNMMSYRDRHNYINDIPSVSMYSLHSNDSYAQVEEERTHKLRNEMKQKLKSQSWSGNAYQNQANVSIPKHSSKMENMQPRVEEHVYTTVVYNFNDEKLPYRVKVPGNRITLKQFKEFMPKKGNYRYFFITPCEDLGAVQEEITDEHRVLPLWEGKVDARIKTIK